VVKNSDSMSKHKTAANSFKDS